MSGGVGWMTWLSGKDSVSPDVIPIYRAEASG